MEEEIRKFIKLTLTEDAYKRNTGKKYSAYQEMKALVDNTSPVPLRFFTMTELNKVGVNPNSSYGTPTGVYCYPLDDEHFGRLVNNSLPFVSDAPNCTVLERRPGAEFLVLDTLENGIISSKAEADELTVDAILKTTPVLPVGADEEIIQNTLKYVIKQNIHAHKNPDARLFGNLYVVAGGAPTTWTRLMRSAGIDGCYDPGNGVIHANEPCQCVMLSQGAYRVVRSFNTSDVRRQTGELSYASIKKCKSTRQLLRWLQDPNFDRELVFAACDKLFWLGGLRLVTVDIMKTMRPDALWIVTNETLRRQDREMANRILSLSPEVLKRMKGKFDINNYVKLANSNPANDPPF